MDIETVKKEYDELLRQLSDPGLISDSPASNASRSDAGWEKFEELLKKKARLEKIIEKERELKEIKNKIEENKSIITAKEDLELSSLAETEIVQLNERLKNLEAEIKKLLTELPFTEAKVEKRTKSSLTPNADFAGISPKVKEMKNIPTSSRMLDEIGIGSMSATGQAVIIEIRAGTGGKESALFAANLFRMYSRYGQLQGWKERILDSHRSELGGFKEIIFELKPARNASHSDAGRDGDVWSKMKFEGGVHRVQRIPETEKQGRVHTSTATVAVLPKPKKTEIKINPQDLKTDFYRASGKGGQNVNKRETAVRITHKPSGIVVTSQTERNQLQNRENAMAILEVRLLEKKGLEEEGKISGKRKTQIKWAKRAEKIRTYNFPQDRVTDHRVKKSWHNIEGVMNGKLELVVEALRKNETID